MQRALVPEDLLHNGQRERRSFIRAVTAVALATKHNMRPDTLLAKTWPDDSVAPRVLRAAQSPTSSGGFPAMQAVRVLPMLAPAAASMRLLGLATSVDLAGVMTVSIPYIGASGKPPPTPFVGEGLPLPVADLMFSGVTVGPNEKIADRKSADE